MVREYKLTREDFLILAKRQVDLLMSTDVRSWDDVRYRVEQAHLALDKYEETFQKPWPKNV